MTDARRFWRTSAARRPYYSVLTDPRFDAPILDEPALQEFFQTGRDYVAALRAQVADHFGRELHARRALDFGCGVGRLTLALAGLCDEVIGADVSERLLAVAETHRRERGVTNVAYLRTAGDAAKLPGTFDFINCFIVFQHIPPRRGLRILHDLLAKLERDGIAALHFTYARDGAPLRRAGRALRRRLSLVNGALNLLRGRSPAEPCMPMYEYDLCRVFGALRAHQCGSVCCRFTEHGDARGVLLLCRKVEAPSL